jgi:hypothetical protein
MLLLVLALFGLGVGVLVWYRSSKTSRRSAAIPDIQVPEERWDLFFAATSDLAKDNGGIISSEAVARAAITIRALSPREVDSIRQSIVKRVEADPFRQQNLGAHVPSGSGTLHHRDSLEALRLGACNAADVARWAARDCSMELAETFRKPLVLREWHLLNLFAADWGILSACHQGLISGQQFDMWLDIRDVTVVPLVANRCGISCGEVLAGLADYAQAQTSVKNGESQLPWRFLDRTSEQDAMLLVTALSRFTFVCVATIKCFRGELDLR